MIISKILLIREQLGILTIEFKLEDTFLINLSSIV